jgi:type IV fimbrial biogenesis protein FimT
MLFVRGFSLISALIAIAVLAIVLAIGTPSLMATVKTNKVVAQYNQLLSLLNMARQHALTFRSFVIVCPSEDGKVCNKQWTDGIMVFVDRDKNQLLDNTDVFVKYIHHRYPDVMLTWRGFGVSSYLYFAPTGFTDNKNGTFRFCIDGNDLSFNRALIVSKSGRIRQSRDSDNDRVHEDASGNDIKCS